MWKRCTDKHPTKQKIDQIFNLMEELGIEIDWSNGTWISGLMVTDKEYEETFLLMDLEDSPGEFTDHFTSLPPMVEYKLLKERPE